MGPETYDRIKNAALAWQNAGIQVAYSGFE
jgi:hypothetical protein